MLHPCQVAAPFQILNARDNIAWLFVPFDGTIKKVSLGLLPGNENDNGDAIFDVTVNGATVFPVEADRPKIVSGELTGFVVGLDFAVVEGQLLFFHAKDIPLGGLQGPVMLQVTMDDGVLAGVALAGDLGGTNEEPLVVGLRSIPIADWAAGSVFADDFADNAFDGVKWTRSDAGLVIEQNARLEITSFAFASSNVGGLDVTDKQMTVKVSGPGGTGFVRLLLNGGLNYLEFRVSSATGNLKAGRHIDGTGDDWALDVAYDGSPIWVRFVHDSVTGHWTYHTSPDGVAFTLRGEQAPPNAAGQTACGLSLFALAGVVYFDEITSNVSIVDAGIVLSDGQVLVYDVALGQFKNKGIVGLIPYSPQGTFPVAAPAGLPAGFTALHYEGGAAKKCRAWNRDTNVWDVREFNS